MELIKINLTKIIRERLGSRGRYIPGFFLRMLERVICQDRLNELLRIAYPAEGCEFSERIIRELDVEVEVEGLENLPEGEAFEFASNHPLGGFDGIALVGVLGRKYGDDNLRVLVNDMLMNVTPLRRVFLAVNKYGSQGRDSARLIREAFESGQQILMFPAGLVSRLHDDGVIRDLKWQKAFVVKALEYGRRIVPVRFEGLNSPRFYKLARLRKKLGVKVNLEQALLPSELCRSQGKRFKITFFPPVDAVALKAEGRTPAEIADIVRKAAGN